MRLYVEEAFPEGTLLWLWQQLQNDHMPSYLWTDGKALSITEFIRFFSDPNRLLILPLMVPHDEEPKVEHTMGLTWADHIERHRCHAHFAFLRRYWGHDRPLSAIIEGLRLLFSLPLQPPLELVVAQAHAQNLLALRLWKQLGVHISSETIPGWYVHADGTSHAGRFGYLVRSEFFQLFKTTEGKAA